MSFPVSRTPAAQGRDGEMPSALIANQDNVSHVKRIPNVFRDLRVIGFSAGCLIAGFLVGMLIFGSPWHLPPDWGDIPTWLTLVVATAGGGIALWQLGLQRQQIKEQQQVLAREAVDRRRTQASRVFIWEERGQDNRLTQAQVASGAVRGEVVTAHVKNTSDQPVYSLEIRWYQHGSANYLESAAPETVLMPGRETEASHFLPQEDANQFGATLRFLDANQVRWNRYPDGQLFEVAE
jgi:hypothetical protein